MESSLALAPLTDSVRSELARGRSHMVKVLGMVAVAWSSIITQRGGYSFGADGCAEDASCACRPKVSRQKNCLGTFKKHKNRDT